MPATAPPASPLATSFVRTFTPAVVALALSLLGRKVDIIDKESLNGFVGLALFAVWYAVPRLLEEKVDRRFGWMLGKAAKPVYVDPQAAVGGEDLPAGGGGLPAPSLLDQPAMTVESLAPPAVVVNVYNGPGGGSIGVEPQDPEPKRSPRRRT